MLAIAAVTAPAQVSTQSPAQRQQTAALVIGAYGATAKAMTVMVPGAHLVELLQLDPGPQTTAPADANVIGAWVRVTSLISIAG